MKDNKPVLQMYGVLCKLCALLALLGLWKGSVGTLQYDCTLLRSKFATEP